MNQAGREADPDDSDFQHKHTAYFSQRASELPDALGWGVCIGVLLWKGSDGQPGIPRPRLFLTRMDLYFIDGRGEEWAGRESS